MFPTMCKKPHHAAGCVMWLFIVYFLCISTLPSKNNGRHFRAYHYFIISGNQILVHGLFRWEPHNQFRGTSVLLPLFTFSSLPWK